MESNFEEVLKELGQFGKFQLYNYVLIALPITFAAFFDLSYVFTAGDVDYRCLVEECDGSPPHYRTDWFNEAVPLDDGKPARCVRFAPLNWSLPYDTGTCGVGNITVECNSWVYDETVSTIASEFQLVCDIEWKRNFIGTVNNIGQFIGLPFAGILSDRIGRKKALVIALCLTSIMGVLRSFAWSYESFAVFESLDPLVSAGVYSTSFVLGMELVGPDKRVLAGTIISVFYAVGEALLGAVAMWLRSWRLLLRVVYIPALIFISYIWLIPESVRWLVSKGKLRKAEEILRRAAKRNGVVLGDGFLHKVELIAITKENMEEEQRPKEDGPKCLMRGILTSRVLLLRFITCCFCWLATAFVFFGLTLNSVAVAGDKYVNFMLVGLIEVPAYVVIYFTMDRFHRRYYQGTCLALCCVCLVVFTSVSAELVWLRLLLFFLSKMVITISYTALYVYTAEMFPTPIRHSVITVSCMLSRLGTMIAPLTPLLMKYWDGLPLVLFAGMSLFAAFLALLFPETLGRNLPDTIEEAENIGKARM